MYGNRIICPCFVQEKKFSQRIVVYLNKQQQQSEEC